MRYILICFVVIGLLACEAHGFEADRRQMLAIEETRSHLARAHGFSVVHFKEDTLQNSADDLKNAIQYTLDFTYKDSNNVQQSKQGIVTFAPAGYGILKSEITDRQ